MTDCGCCGRCIHPICPPEAAQPPYDEVSHEIENNMMSIKVPKNVGHIQALRGPGKDQGPNIPQFDVSCTGSKGKKCRDGCVKVNVIPNKVPPAKKPEEEMFLLRSTRQYLNADDMKNSLEIEFKTPRNYIPWPDPGPTPPIIAVVLKKAAGGKKKGKNGKKGKKGKK